MPLQPPSDETIASLDEASCNGDLTLAAEAAADCARFAFRLREILAGAGDPFTVTTACLGLSRLEELVGRARLALPQVTTELSGERQVPARVGGIVAENAHTAAVLYAEETLSEVWSACQDPTREVMVGDPGEPSTADLFLANVRPVARHFLALPRVPVDELARIAHQAETRRASRGI